MTVLNSHDISSDSLYSYRSQIAYIRSLPAIAKAIHTDASILRLLKRTLVFCLNGIRHQAELQQIQRVFDCKELSNVLKLFPAIHEKPFTPYVTSAWSLDQRVEQIQQHFLVLKDLFGENTEQLYSNTGVKLFEFHSSDGESYSVELFPGYQCEGSLGVRLCDSDRREIYTLSFHLSGLVQRTCYIGSLQGPNDSLPDRKETIVKLTRAMHGLRPKALMIEVTYMIAAILDIELILGVSNEDHIYQSSAYTDAKRAQVMFDANALWIEFQAVEFAPSFFKLPESPVRKEIAQLKSKKRSLYRKRYAWLEEVSEETQQVINNLLVNDRLASRTLDTMDKAA